MLAIRLQRQGRKGYPTYRLVVQEAQRTPSSGRVVAYAGSYNPHTKETNLKPEIIAKYLTSGAQPSPRVVKLLLDHKIQLPAWVKPPAVKTGKIRFEDKLRRNRPAEEVAAETTEPAEPAEEPAEQSEATPAEEPEVTEQPVAAELTVEQPAEATEAPTTE